MRIFYDHALTENSDLTFKKTLIDNLYKTIYEPVRSQWSSCRVFQDNGKLSKEKNYLSSADFPSNTVRDMNRFNSLKRCRSTACYFCEYI